MENGTKNVWGNRFVFVYIDNYIKCKCLKQPSEKTEAIRLNKNTKPNYKLPLRNTL
jgi:hypothetical protein